MRTPNTKCVICDKPLYRRPSQLEKVRFVCCKNCRSEAYKKFPSYNSLKNLELGREKGTNHLVGIPKSEGMKKKVSEKNKLFWKQHPDKLIERLLKVRGKNHYNWKGGISSLQIAIRTSAPYLKWVKKILKMDNYECQICKSTEKLEVHHKIPLSKIVQENNIKTLDDARKCKDLWDVNNGIVVCRKCHYKIHNRRYNYED